MATTETGLKEKLAWILESFSFVYPELLLGIGIILVLIVGLIFKRNTRLPAISYSLSILFVILSVGFGVANLSLESSISLFNGTINLDSF
jgi:hypothetical protein